jgi:hypothetical protein
MAGCAVEIDFTGAAFSPAALEGELPEARRTASADAGSLLLLVVAAAAWRVNLGGHCNRIFSKILCKKRESFLRTIDEFLAGLCLWAMHCRNGWRWSGEDST